jgi:hypothetical protein
MHPHRSSRTGRPCGRWLLSGPDYASGGTKPDISGHGPASGFSASSSPRPLPYPGSCPARSAKIGHGAAHAASARTPGQRGTSRVPRANPRPTPAKTGQNRTSGHQSPAALKEAGREAAAWSFTQAIYVILTGGKACPYGDLAAPVGASHAAAVEPPGGGTAGFHRHGCSTGACPTLAPVPETPRSQHGASPDRRPEATRVRGRGGGTAARLSPRRTAGCGWRGCTRGGQNSVRTRIRRPKPATAGSCHRKSGIPNRKPVSVSIRPLRSSVAGEHPYPGQTRTWGPSIRPGPAKGTPAPGANGLRGGARCGAHGLGTEVSDE